MKKIKLVSVIMIVIMTVSLLATGCALSPMKEDTGGYKNGVTSEGGASSPMKPDADTGAYDGGYSDSVETGDTEHPEYAEGGATASTVTQRPTGLITASAWNDNDNYGLWLAQFVNDGGTGKFYDNTLLGWGLYSQDRIEVTVSANGTPVANARVVSYDNVGQQTFAAVTDAAGVAYLFPQLPTSDAVTVKVYAGDQQAEATLLAADGRELTVELDNAPLKQEVIEIMYVVDVTGSMGDELTYLKNELADVVERVRIENPQATVRLALMFYRDKNDAESIAYYDFEDVTSAEGLSAQQAAIDRQYAMGGGDYPEMVDEALLAAVDKSWSEGSTKIIFQVLDAPPHSESSDKQGFSSAVLTAAEKGIRICPIICSGADSLTEWLMREAAIQTGGTFVFVTDDSGIGGSHHDPELPNTVVEALNLLMVRLINGYHSGVFAPPVAWTGEN